MGRTYAPISERSLRRRKFWKKSWRRRISSAALGFIDENALGGTVEVVVLAALQCPQESDQAYAAKEKRDGYQVDENRHAKASACSFRVARAKLLPHPVSLNAFAMTTSDDADIATAAISGVT